MNVGSIRKPGDVSQTVPCRTCRARLPIGEKFTGPFKIKYLLVFEASPIYSRLNVPFAATLYTLF